ncbi:MAG: PASTA domain-containing protein [Lachnospiraceae bacterium]|nr:PASTA domain-containing protein [Lachnospiraceae bacterium]
MKKLSSILLVCVLVLSLTGCSKIPFLDNRIAIPDIVDTDEATAKNILSSNGLIPSVKYENNDNVEQGNVIRTEPEIGTKVDKNSKITIYISDGPSYVVASNASAEWYCLSSEDDVWEFYTPCIENGVLYIECYNVTFGCDMEWNDSYNSGELFGIASINESFDKTVPVVAIYEKQSWKANEAQSFILEIPLKDLNVSRPTNMYLRLYTNNESDVYINFYISW